MSKTSKHYLATGTAYTGPVHKMGKVLHTGAAHTAKSKKVTHTPPKTKK